MVIVAGGRGLGIAVAMTLLAAGGAQAQDAFPEGARGLRDRFVGQFGQDRLDALSRGDAEADRVRAAGWLSRWIVANRVGAPRPVSPAEVPAEDPAGTR